MVVVGGVGQLVGWLVGVCGRGCVCVRACVRVCECVEEV